MNNMSNIIEISNLTLPYCFNDFSIKFKKDQFISIVGPNSCGKTTLLKTITGQIFTENTVSIFNQEINYYRITEINMLIKSLFNDEFTFDEPTVFKELYYSIENENIDSKLKTKKIKQIMKEFELDKIKNKNINKIKKYEKINLQLAKILLQMPKIILLDNIFMNYPIIEKEKVINILKKFQKENDLTIILTTIDLTDTIQSDYLFVLYDNRIMLEGIPDEVLIKDNILNRIGLELPFKIDLCVKLKDYDLIEKIDKNCSLEELVNLLWK